MNSLDELTTITKPGFIEHVFQFNDSAKAESLNITQYAALAILPVVLLNKSIAKWIPEADADKGSPEIIIEVLSQTTVMFLGMMMIHRIITYIPTYSKTAYEDFHPTAIILAVLMIILSLQTNLGEKIAILTDRVIELWEGKPKSMAKKKSASQQAPPPAISGVSPLPPPQQTSPDFNSMYQQNPTPLVNAQTPGQESYVPMAANDANSAFGAALGSSW